MDTIITNEWTNAALKKPIIGRKCIVACEDGSQHLAIWNGFYWINANSGRRSMTNGLTQKHNIVAWYMYEKFNPNNMI